MGLFGGQWLLLEGLDEGLYVLDGLEFPLQARRTQHQFITIIIMANYPLNGRVYLEKKMGMWSD